MKSLITFVLAACLVALGGCNTMEGLGKDLRELGERIQKKAQ